MSPTKETVSGLSRVHSLTFESWNGLHGRLLRLGILSRHPDRLTTEVTIGLQTEVSFATYW